MKENKLRCDHKLVRIFNDLNIFMLVCINHGRLGIFQEVTQEDIESEDICFEDIYEQDGKFYEFLLSADKFYELYN